MKQMQIKLQHEQYKLTPSSSEPEPFIWIKEIRFYGDGFTNLRRAIKLRKGLNILWSTSTSSSGEKSKASGHAAGKSLFCRMIRYIIGEPTFANKHTTEEIQENFINGIIAAEIGLAGKTWLIVRPIGLWQKHSAYFNTTFDMLQAGTMPEPIPYKEFQEQLNRLFMAKYPLQKVPNTLEDISWNYIYPMLTKDQECRFNHPLNWREPESESEAKNPSYEKNSYIIRGFISDISTPEQDLIQKEEKLESEINRLKHDAPIRKYHYDAFKRYWENNLDSTLLAFEDQLFFDTAAQLLSTQIAKQTEMLEALKPSSKNNEALNRFTEAKGEETKIQAEYDKQTEDLEIARIRLRSLQGEPLKKAEEQIIDYAKALEPAPSFRCNTLIDEAIAHGCPCYQKHQLQHNIQWEAEKKKTNGLEIIAYKSAIEACERRLKEIEEKLQESRKKASDAKTIYVEEQSSTYEKMRSINQELRRLQQIQSTIEQGKKAFDEMDKTKTALDQQSKELDHLKEDIRELKKKSNQKDRLVAAFSHALRHIIDNHFYGKISFARNSMLLESRREDKEQDSAGYTSIKCVALDYAMLSLGIDGSIPHPRFLLHDSPKESDMGDEIYHSLFEYVKSMEDSFANKEPSFQYIITTTAPPPEKFQQEPYLINPVLDAAIPEKRLLGIDL